MEFVLDLGIPNVARATLQQAIMSMMEWHHTGLYHPCFNSKTTALLGFISWCWWLKNISQGPLKPGDPESKAAKKAEEGTCQSKDGDKRHGSAQLPFFFFFCIQILLLQATDPDMCTENSLHLLSLFITWNHIDALPVPFTVLPLAKCWPDFLSHSPNDNYKIYPLTTPVF